MRSDFKDNTINTINKMIQFGTVKYGIVKQLKDRSRSEKELIGDQDEGASMPCSPIAECKPSSPELQRTIVLDCTRNNEDHNHNNNSSEDREEDRYATENDSIKTESLYTYPQMELHQKSLSPKTATSLTTPTLTPTQTLMLTTPPTPTVITQPVLPILSPVPVSQVQMQIPVHPQAQSLAHSQAQFRTTTTPPPSSLTPTHTKSLSPSSNHHLREIQQHHRQNNKVTDEEHEEKEDQVMPEDHNMSDGEDDIPTSVKTAIDASTILSRVSGAERCSGSIKDDDDEECERINGGDGAIHQSEFLGDCEDDQGQYKNDDIAIEQQIRNDGDCSPQPTMPQFPAAPMTLEAIQNMQMAIAQFAAKTLANGGADNEAAMKQLAFLQQTLFNLQQQQIFQMQLIQQLQSQLALNQLKPDEEQEHDQDQDHDHENDRDHDDEDEDQMCAENLSNHKSDSIGAKDTTESMDIVSGNETDSEIDHHETVTERVKELNEESVNASGFSRLGVHRIKSEEEHNETHNHIISSSNDDKPSLLPPVLIPKQDENTPLPYGSDLASSIITNHDHPPSLDEPNSLEMLQKRAQEVLDSASQGILAGNLADEFAFGKDKSGDGKNRNEPFFKHRCRYCGKVFGSDSALQIHIRSHTGERPFKCNVCGSRFTTKGNLKVHFQRHAQKFPHVPMNSTPIPEHLDKFHPPLLEQMSPETSPQHQPQMPHVNVPNSLPLPFPPGAGFPGLPLYRPPLEILKSLGHYPNPFFSALPPMPVKRDQDLPTDLRKPAMDASPNSIKSEPASDEPISLRIKEESRLGELPQPPQSQQQQQQSEQLQPTEAKRPKSTTPPRSATGLAAATISTAAATAVTPLVTCAATVSVATTATATGSTVAAAVSPPQSHSIPQLPPIPGQPPTPIRRDHMDHQERHPLNFSKLSPENRSPIRSPASIPRSPFLGPMKHEMALLPRPHSNDNSWENFIEVSNTSDTVKLKELMKDKKLTDPNQCVVCDRVLSCKSALQMHYRTHTGERPFKCRICGRAFTTKGNLKTHMAVHKIRPPMRNFHQCPVCHKKYSNALVLQQHIRLHTGEPTDLTPEQIQAAEIRDFPPSMMPGSFLNPFAFNFGMGGGHNGMMGSESSQGDNEEGMDCSDDFDDEDISDHMSNGGDSDRPKSRDDMKGMLFEQKLKIENNRPKSEASTSSAPTSPVSAVNKSSPAPSDTSQGALDLTPRSSIPPYAAPPNYSHLLPTRPPFGMFPNLPLFPPVSTTTQNMCSAMNSIAQSVMPSAPFNPLALSGVRGSTTCGICFKTFPCHSALEIHYRSHTKERPFKCSICDRGFTTKGNLKQHMLTHKIRDMEQDAFRNRAIKYTRNDQQDIIVHYQMGNWKEEFE